MRVRKASSSSSLVDALAVAALQLAVRAHRLVRVQVGAGDARLRQPVAVVDLERKEEMDEEWKNGRMNSGELFERKDYLSEVGLCSRSAKRSQPKFIALSLLSIIIVVAK